MTGAFIFVVVVAFVLGAIWAALVILLALTKRKR